jgi:chromosome partitioning protein
MIVSMLNLKGGVGKTTSTMHLATVAARDEAFKTVTVLDADEEGSTLSWAAMANKNGQTLGFAVERGDKNGLAKQAKGFDGADKVVLIDAPPNNREVLTVAAMVSSLVIVPVQPSAVDVDRLVNTLAMLQNVEAAKGSLTAGILLTRFDKRQRMAQYVLEALGEFSVFENHIKDLARYREAFGKRPGYLFEYEKVWDEIKAVV